MVPRGGEAASVSRAAVPVGLLLQGLGTGPISGAATSPILPA